MHKKRRMHSPAVVPFPSFGICSAYLARRSKDIKNAMQTENWGCILPKMLKTSLTSSAI